MKRKGIIVFLISLMGVLTAQMGKAQAVFLRKNEAAPWAAVGRLNSDGLGFCTATLIGTDQILTAAHCLRNPKTGEEMPAHRLTFVSGFHTGAYKALSKGKSYFAHSAFIYEAEPHPENDIAVIKLETPIKNVSPRSLADQAEQGEEVILISYDVTRPFAPMRQECKIAFARERLLLLACAVNFGNSGGPVFNQQGEIIGVISAKTRNGLSIARRITPDFLSYNPE